MTARRFSGAVRIKVSSPETQLAAWLRQQQREGRIKINVDSDGVARDFDCFLCGRNFDFFSNKTFTAASVVAAHVKACMLTAR